MLPRPTVVRHGTSIRPLNILVDGVFEGGGALGAAYAGALRVLDDNNIWFARVAGASAGAITAALIAAGFTAPEIQWLMTSYPGFNERAPGNLLERKIKAPIPFEEFLDFPKLEDIDKGAREKTILWKTLNGTVIDYIGAWSIGIPTRKNIVDEVLKNILGLPLIGAGIKAIPNAKKEIKKVLKDVLAVLPEKSPQIKDFLIDNPDIRKQLAHGVWDLIAKYTPVLRAETNLFFEGGLFEGKSFLSIFSKLINKKVKNNEDVDVQFKDLKIPLAIITMDSTSKKMKVFSNKTDPDVRVVDAVRCSMSIPIVFQPYKIGSVEYVDGGLISNFPAWLFTDGGKNYWEASDVDNSRPKIGFQLDDTLTGNGGGRENDQLTKEITNFLTQKVKDDLGIAIIGTPSAIEKHIIDEALYAAKIWVPDIRKLINIVGTMITPVSSPEESLRPHLLKSLMAGMNYYDVVIPLKGYHWLDFSINKNEKELKFMWERAKKATLDKLKSSPNPLII